MATYVIFNCKTGDLVQTHTEPEDVNTSKEGLLSMVDPSYDRDLLDVVLVDTDTLIAGESYSVDLCTRQLMTLKKGEIAGFGAGVAQLFDPQTPPRPLRTVYEPDSTETSTKTPKKK